MTPSERYAAAFGDGLEDFAVAALDDLGVTLHSAVLPGTPDRHGGSGLGYGATPEQARTGALGEMAEMALSARALAGQERVLASYEQLCAERGADRVQDPRTLCLEAGTGYTGGRPLQWLPMTRLRDGETVLVPAELVASGPEDLPGPPPPDGWLTTVITNGQGAAFDARAATAHALLELLQRDGNATAFRAMDAGVVVDLEGLSDPASLDVLARARAIGVEPLVKLASTDFGIPDVYVVGCSADASEPVPIMVTACGEAAHPDAELAVRKALLEWAAARTRKAFMHGPLDVVRSITPAGYLERWTTGHPPERLVEEDRALEAMLEWSGRSGPELVERLSGTVLSQRRTVALRDLPTSAPADLHDHVVAALAAEGLDVLLSVQPSPDGDVVAVKALVPGLEVETVSYGRIGERGVRRLRDRDSELVAVGDRPDGPGWAAVHLTEDARERLGGPAWFDRAARDRVVGPLYPLYREPGRHVAAMTVAAMSTAAT